MTLPHPLPPAWIWPIHRQTPRRAETHRRIAPFHGLWFSAIGFTAAIELVASKAGNARSFRQAVQISTRVPISMVWCVGSRKYVAALVALRLMIA
jgi:hypothetical protein